MADDAGELLRSPLHERHVELGAKFAPFGGWSMPVEYARGGVLAEHAAVRSAVGIFDVSHLGKVTVNGPGSVDFLNRCLTADLSKVGSGQAQYTLLCAVDGGVVDDLIVYRRSAHGLLLIPNAANTAQVTERLAAEAPKKITVENRHRDFAVIAVQGHEADEVLATAGFPVGHDYMTFVDVVGSGGGAGKGSVSTVCRTGYTGERGYELVVPSDHAVDVWDRLVAAGAAYGLRACGLGARDTLRTEMGYPLHGQDISPLITPVQARLSWAVGWAKPEFFGARALREQRRAGADRVLRGIKAVGRGIPRPGMVVRDAAAQDIGVVTSGTFSPTLKTGIGLALVTASQVEGTEVGVDIRSRTEQFVITKPPFVTPGVRA